MAAEKASERRQIGVLLGSHKLQVALLSASSAAGGLVEALFLVAVTRAAFAITEGQSTFSVVAGIKMTDMVLVIVALAMVVIRVGLAGASAWLSAQLSGRVVASIRSEMASAYLQANWSSQHGERGGRLQELLTTFTNQGAQLVKAITQSIVAGCNLAALLLIAVLVDPLSSVAVIGAVVVLGSALRPFRVAVKRQAMKTSASGMEFATALSEMSQLGMEMHVFNVQPRMRQRVTELIDNYESTNRKMIFLGGMVPVVYSGLAYVALVGALGIGSAIDSANFETVGAVMLVMLRSLSYGQALQANVVSVNASLPFLDVLNGELVRYQRARMVDQGQPVGSVGQLSLMSVSFEYTPGVPVLRTIDAKIEPREVVGIVGPSGSGKSTLVQLLLGLRDPTSGRVLADRREICTFSRSEWARKVTHVPQQAHLIAGTVSDNIRFMRDDVSQADIERASRMAQLHDDVLRFDEGYERQVGEQGSHLSGGQQQRLIIARALVDNPDVLILDEPTSALDVRSESLIRETLGGLKERMTVIIIAHRLSTLEICDRIMVIQDGQLMGFDPPAALERSSEFFRESLRLSGVR